jgi:hypothetical protein
MQNVKRVGRYAAGALAAWAVIQLAGTTARGAVLVQWGVIVNQPLGDKLCAMGKPLATDSKGFEAYQFAGEQFLSSLRDGLAAKQAPIVFHSFTMMTPDQMRGLPDGMGESFAFSGMIQVSPGLMLPINSSGGGQCGFHENGGAVNLDVAIDNEMSTVAGKMVGGTMKFNGDLPAGDAVVFVRHLPPSNGLDLDEMIVWETAACTPEEQPYLQVINQTPKWIALGPAALVADADQRIATAKNAQPVGEKVRTHWTKTLAEGSASGVVKVLAVCLPDANPFQWWDADGAPVVVPASWERVLDNLDHLTNGKDALVVLSVNNPATDTVAAASDAEGYFGSGDISMLTAPWSDGSRIVAINVAQAGAGRALNVEIGIGVGPWTEAAKLQKGESVRAGKATYKLVGLDASQRFGPLPGLSKYTQASLEFSERDDTEVTLGFVDASGHETEIDSPTLPMPERLHSKGKAWINAGAYVDASSIDHVVVKTRPRRWATFTLIAGAAVNP